MYVIIQPTVKNQFIYLNQFKERKAWNKPKPLVKNQRQLASRAR